MSLHLQSRNMFKQNEDDVSIESYAAGIRYSSSSPNVSVTPYKYDPGHILRHTTLKAVTAQLRSASVSYFLNANKI